MIRLFCSAHHEIGRTCLCPACNELLDYAVERLRKCLFGENKGVCSQCRIHCHKPDMRRNITQVMRYSCPKMITRHPLLAIDHL